MSKNWASKLVVTRSACRRSADGVSVKFPIPQCASHTWESIRGIFAVPKTMRNEGKVSDHCENSPPPAIFSNSRNREKCCFSLSRKCARPSLRLPVSAYWIGSDNTSRKSSCAWETFWIGWSKSSAICFICQVAVDRGGQAEATGDGENLAGGVGGLVAGDRKSTRLNSSHAT